ncbi:MAG TPA: low temperature requirement protein A [Solirubrobacteraceae bacterium]|jgi:low temperature requirement protein LtrA|nr:low temperature requirement protein A [Solirubrobacteraceae bacterium]
MSRQAVTGRAHRLTPVLREEETVTPLELFFDLVFVLAFTQCTALMAAEPTWHGLAKGLLVLGVLWWSWVGYAWLTSVLDPEADAVRLVIFVAMAALLIVGLCVPEAFGEAALLFACAYAIVRIAHIALFMLASRDEPNLRWSVLTLAASTALGSGLLLGAAFADGTLQGALWLVAIVLDMAGPCFFGTDGWKLVPEHFTERHGLIVIIALGESIVAVGVGAEHGVNLGVALAAVIATAIAAALWWLYFDVVAIVAGRRLAEAPPGGVQNAMARDSYSYLHLPMVAGIVLVALGVKKTLGHVDEPLKLVPAVALLGGTAMYLLAHVAFRYRHIHTLNSRRLGVAILLVAFVAAAVEIPALATLAALAAALALLIAIETRSYGASRARLRHGLRDGM